MPIGGINNLYTSKDRSGACIIYSNELLEIIEAKRKELLGYTKKTEATEIPYYPQATINNIYGLGPTIDYTNKDLLEAHEQARNKIFRCIR